MTAHLTPEERAERGRTARLVLPPAEQARLVLPPERPDPVTLLAEQGRTRVPELLPVRHARMAVSPFTFFRGNALGMAVDLGAGPVSGLVVQMCGDAHLSNFGMFASPERRLMFDVNDFDETTPGPWEWDVKRLVTSVVVAGRGNGFKPGKRRRAVLAAMWRYQRGMTALGGMRVLDGWYARTEMERVEEMLGVTMTAKQRAGLDSLMRKARSRDSLKAFAKLTETVDGTVRFKADPPLLVPLDDLLPPGRREDMQEQIKHVLHGYRDTLSRDRRQLFDRFEFVDLARKVVGVGSVGTRCWVVLLRGRDEGDPLFLQVKEAEASVLEAYVPAAMRPRYRPHNQGERVVEGQRLMQAASDILLGWQRVEGIDGQARDFYVRQLMDMKGSAPVEELAPRGLTDYSALCGWTLARAHARSGDALAIAAYLGDDTDTTFAEAMVEFAESYADQNERDHAAFVQALRAGRLPAASAA